MLEKTWRWFGEKDNITLAEIKQIGIEGIVTALHHLPNGSVWTAEEIIKVKKQIESHGMHWSVVESLPVHEAIKYGGVQRDLFINAYKESLVNLAKCGVTTVCYNFMPVIDWIRTNLSYVLPNGNEVLYFDFIDFVAFDRYILERKQAEDDYPLEIVSAAKLRFESMSADDKKHLIDTIIIKTQGFIDGITANNPDEAVKKFKSRLSDYKHIDNDGLRSNLKYFLDAIIDTAETHGIKMCIHPDDPPMPILGLPRIVSSASDIKWILDTAPSAANGVTFCTGSLSAGKQNELNKMVSQFASRIYFAHLRSTSFDGDYNFYEAEHLEGGIDMYTVVTELLKEQAGRKNKIPMRVDHGRKMLSDFKNEYNPGYTLIGRMKAMAELTGMQYAILEQNRTNK